MSDNDITINDELMNAPPVQLFNEKPQSIDISTLVTPIAIATSDMLAKIQSFNKYYKDTMIEFRKEKPDEWEKLIINLKKTYIQGNVPLDVVIELISALTIEYEIGLQENNVITEFSKALYEFKNKE